jgi:hypothetical protein
MGEIVTIEQAAARTNLGMQKIRNLAKESNSVLKFGRAYRINIQKLLDYLYTFEA